MFFPFRFRRTQNEKQSLMESLCQAFFPPVLFPHAFVLSSPCDHRETHTRGLAFLHRIQVLGRETGIFIPWDTHSCVCVSLSVRCDTLKHRYVSCVHATLTLSLFLSVCSDSPFCLLCRREENAMWCNSLSLSSLTGVYSLLFLCLTAWRSSSIRSSRLTGNSWEREETDMHITSGTASRVTWLPVLHLLLSILTQKKRMTVFASNQMMNPAITASGIRGRDDGITGDDRREWVEALDQRLHFDSTCKEKEAFVSWTSCTPGTVTPNSFPLPFIVMKWDDAAWFNYQTVSRRGETVSSGCLLLWDACLHALPNQIQSTSERREEWNDEMRKAKHILLSFRYPFRRFKNLSHHFHWNDSFLFLSLLSSSSLFVVLMHEKRWNNGIALTRINIWRIDQVMKKRRERE